MNKLKCDFHTHTKYSLEPRFLVLELRALYSPEKLIKTAITRGLDCLAITEHNTMSGALLGEKYIKKAKIKDFTFIKGEEMSTKDGHLIGLGLQEPIKRGLSVEETADKITDQGGLIFAPHPFTYLGIQDKVKDVKNLAAIEIFNPNYWFTTPYKFKTDYHEKYAKRNNLSMLVNTDAHILTCIGKIFTEVNSEPGIDNVLKAIKKHKTFCPNRTSFLRSLRNVLSSLGLVSMSWRPKPKFIQT